MKRKPKQILALLLSVFMLLSLVPVSVNAQDAQNSLGGGTQALSSREEANAADGAESIAPESTANTGEEASSGTDAAESNANSTANTPSGGSTSGTESADNISDSTANNAADNSTGETEGSLAALAEGEETVTELSGKETISAGGSYKLASGATGLITISTKDAVTVEGAGVTWDSSYNITDGQKYTDVQFNCVEGANLTLKDVYIENTGTADTAPLVNFTGAGNILNIEGTVLLEKTSSGQGTYAAIHVPLRTSLTIGGTGTLYLYKTSGGSGIGGNKNEMNGEITFGTVDEKGNPTSDLTVFAKGTKQGALIGAGTGASSTSSTPGAVKFVEGEYNLISNSRGAVIGGSAGSTGGSTGTTVYVERHANININTDYSGASVGGGGHEGGNDASGGYLVVGGGSLRVYIDKNAANNAATGWNGQTFTEGVNDMSITAKRVDSLSYTSDGTAVEGTPVYKLAFDTAMLQTAATEFDVNIDGEDFYNGGLPRYGFVQEGLDKGEQLSISSTPSNWYLNGETNLYFYVTGENHEVTVNGETFGYVWNEEKQIFCTYGEPSFAWSTGYEKAIAVFICRSCLNTHVETATVTSDKKDGVTTYTATVTFNDKEYTDTQTEEAPVETEEMYRLYNPNSGEHFYTASAEEKEKLDAAGWNYEGVAWVAPKTSGTPVYRLYNPNAGDHHYTTSKEERDMLVGAGWNDENIGWYSDDARGTPLYRLYNPNAVSGAHHYTVSTEECFSLITAGWKYEGIGWYGIKQ